MIKPEDIKEHETEFQTYHAALKILYSNKASVNEMIPHINEKYGTDIPHQINAGLDGAMTVLMEEDRTILIIADKDTDISELHHECCHATSFLLYLIQTPHNNDTDEVFAYLSQSVFSTAYKVLLEHFKIPKKNFFTVSG